MGRITLYGFLQFDKTLFDDIVLPEAIDKANLIDTILMESGDLYPYYQHPLYLKRNINNWFARMLPQFERMVTALTEEYNPIHNYDRYEESTDNRVNHLDGVNSIGKETSGATTGFSNVDGVNNKNGTMSNNGTVDGQTSSSGANNGTTERKVSAYNTSTYQPQEQDSTSGNTSLSDSTHNSSYSSESSSERETSSLSSSESTSETFFSSESAITRNDSTDDSRHNAHLYGNIGVTTSATMVTEELQLRFYDLVLEIAKEFERRFITQVY